MPISRACLKSIVNRWVLPILLEWRANIGVKCWVFWPECGQSVDWQTISSVSWPLMGGPEAHRNSVMHIEIITYMNILTQTHTHTHTHTHTPGFT